MIINARDTNSLKAATQGEFGPGLRVLVASFLGIGIGVSSLYLYTLGVFIKPMAAQFGWSRADASLGALIGTAGVALMSMPAGRLVDRFGSMRVAVISLAILALGFVALGIASHDIGSFLAITAVVSLAAAGSSPVPFTRLVVMAFRRHRGLALGLVLSGTTLGASLIPALLTPFIAVHGWRNGYLVLGGIVILFLPVVWILLLPAKDAAAADAKPLSASVVLPASVLLADRAFLLIGAIFFLASIAVLGTVVHFIPMLTDAGFSPARAGGTAALIGVAAIGGRIISGILLDRTSPWVVTSGVFAFVALGLVALGLGGSALAIPGALVVGLTIGAEVDLLSFLIGRHFVRTVYGQVYGALYGVFLIGGAVGPYLSGRLFDFSGSYRISLLGAAGLLAISSLLSTQLSRLANKERDDH